MNTEEQARRQDRELANIGYMLEQVCKKLDEINRNLSKIRWEDWKPKATKG